jgi:hypothetical protein
MANTASFASDAFSIGCVVHYVCFGSHPFGQVLLSSSLRLVVVGVVACDVQGVSELLGVGMLSTVLPHADRSQYFERDGNIRRNRLQLAASTDSCLQDLITRYVCADLAFRYFTR